MGKQCRNPQATRKIVNPGTGPLAYCPGCKEWRKAKQVPWGKEKRAANNNIIASYAPIAH